MHDARGLRDAATFEKPHHQYAEGYSHVIVNGQAQVVYENGAMTAARPGRVFHGPEKRAPAQ